MDRHPPWLNWRHCDEETLRRDRTAADPAEGSTPGAFLSHSPTRLRHTRKAGLAAEWLAQAGYRQHRRSRSRSRYEI